ncbi:MAG: hypothetical protein IJZ57_10040 [Clostridia bacterium]|nr:hypothetical protein [Clostridia bacterium]
MDEKGVTPPIRRLAPEKRIKKITACFEGQGGYFFLCSTIAINNPTMPITTRENENKFSYVTNCINITPQKVGAGFNRLTAR